MARKMQKKKNKNTKYYNQHTSNANKKHNKINWRACYFAYTTEPMNEQLLSVKMQFLLSRTLHTTKDVKVVLLVIINS